MLEYLFIGLGNPGPEFDHTRHNLGAMALRDWVAQMRLRAVVIDWHEEKRYWAQIAQVRTRGSKVTCLLPLTYMNDSGKAVASYLHDHAVALEHLLIIHDDVELALGVVEASSGSARGHNGVRSIQTTVGITDIPRLRLGIDRPSSTIPLDRYVLSKFSDVEQVPVARMVQEASRILSAKIEATH